MADNVLDLLHLPEAEPVASLRRIPRLPLERGAIGRTSVANRAGP
jgi:hypothetical protein